LYCNDDLELQAAVRAYIDAHWMESMWSNPVFIPPRITDEAERLQFMHLVSEEAQKHQNETFHYSIALCTSELSPVYHLEDKEVEKRLARLIKHVGGNLSYFSDDIRRSWETVKFQEPTEVKALYEQALRVCEHYFEHNPRDFADPFYDLPEEVRREYRVLMQRRTEIIRLKLQKWYARLRHPIRYWRWRKEIPEY
jgi:hypothetical protein